MKKIILNTLSLLLLVGVFVLATPNKTEAAVRIRGYIKNNGTYVTPHYRTSPDRTRINNYSTKGNYNVYTGKIGTKKLY